MGKINIHSTKYFLSLIFKPRKTFHDLVLYYFICYKAEIKRQKNTNKKELVYRYSLIEKDYRKIYSTKFKYILFPFNRSGNNGYKESMEIIILIFRNAPELVVNLFEKNEISFEDTAKLKSDYFNYYHQQIPKINNNFQTINQLINIRNTENNINNHFITSLESQKDENNPKNSDSTNAKKILHQCIDQAKRYAQKRNGKRNGKIKAKIIAAYLFSTGLLDDTMGQIERTKHLSDLIKIKLTTTKHIEDPTYYRKNHDTPFSVLNNLLDIYDFFRSIEFEKSIEYIQEDIESINKTITEEKEH